MKNEALKLASSLDHWATQMDMGRKPDPKSLTRKASAELRRLQAELDAIKQAFAAPVQEPMETYIHHCRYQPHPNDFGIPKGHWWQAKQYADAVNTTPPAAQPAVPDAFGTRDGEHPQYVQGWNDCRAEMLKGMK